MDIPFAGVILVSWTKPRAAFSGPGPARDGAQAFARLRVGHDGQSFRIRTGGERGLLARRAFRLPNRSEGAHGEPDVAHRDPISHRSPDPRDHRRLAHPEFLRPRMVSHDDREDAVPQRQGGRVPRDQRAGDLRPRFPQRNEEGDMREPKRFEKCIEDRRQGRRAFPPHGRPRRIRRTFPPAICPSTAHATNAGIPPALTWFRSRSQAMRGTERWTQTNHPIEKLRNPSRAYPKGMFTASAVPPISAI